VIDVGFLALVVALSFAGNIQMLSVAILFAIKWVSLSALKGTTYERFKRGQYE
jgi:hypothetical protein